MKKMDLIESAIYDDLPYRLDLEIGKPFGLEIEAGLLNQMDRYFIVNDALQKKVIKEIQIHQLVEISRLKYRLHY